MPSDFDDEGRFPPPRGAEPRNNRPAPQRGGQDAEAPAGGLTLAQVAVARAALHSDPGPAHTPITPPKMEPMPAEIAAAVVAIMEKVKPVEKTGENREQKYKFAKVEELLAVLQPELANNGIIPIQTEVHARFSANSLLVTYAFYLQHKSGVMWASPITHTGQARFLNREGGGDDKAYNKCHTSARKYFLLSLFQIPALDAGDSRLSDGDADEGGDEGRRNDAPLRDGGAIQERYAILPLDDREPDRVFKNGDDWALYWRNLIDTSERNGRRHDIAALANANVSQFDAIGEFDQGRYRAVISRIRRAVGLGKDDPTTPLPLLNRQGKGIQIVGPAAWLDAFKDVVDALGDDVTALNAFRHNMETRLVRIAEKNIPLVEQANAYVRARVAQALDLPGRNNPPDNAPAAEDSEMPGFEPGYDPGYDPDPGVEYPPEVRANRPEAVSGGK
jgi:hypothetical protein